MKNIKKAAIVVAMAGGIAMATGGAAFAWDGGAEGGATMSPGVVSGNTIQVPAQVPVNVCSNTISVVGVLNPAFGQPCLGG